MKFNDVLKYFLKNTKSKSGDLAEYVGYDISYISKWTSDVKIPSEGTSEEVLDRVSEFFTKAVCEKDMLEVVENLSPKRLKLKDENSIFFTIRRFFTDAYSLSLSLYEDYKERGRAKNFTLTGTKNISDFTLETLFKHISAADDDVSLYATFDIPKLFDIGTVNNMNIFITKDIKVRFNTAISLDRYDDFTKNDSVTELILMFKAFDIDMHLYDSDDFEDLQVLLLEDKFVIMYRYLPDGSKIATYTEDPSVVSVIQSNVINMFENAGKISESSSSSCFELKHLTSSFQNCDSFLIACAFLNGFALTEKNLEFIKNNYDFSSEKTEGMKTISNFMNTLRPEQNVDFIFMKSKLDEFVETGKINILDSVVFLDNENMIEYLENVIRILEENENINLFTLNDELPINPDDISTSFFVSDQVSMLKKDAYYKNSNVSTYYSYTEEKLCTLVRRSLLKIAETSPYFEKNSIFILDYVKDTMIPKLKEKMAEESEQTEETEYAEA